MNRMERSSAARMAYKCSNELLQTRIPGSNQGGFVIFEAGEKQARNIARLFEETRCFKKAAFIKDYQHISRIVIAQMEECRG